MTSQLLQSRVATLYPMLLECYHHLHPLTESESVFAHVNVDEDCSLDIFE
jgi:hypothetical protein